MKEWAASSKDWATVKGFTDQEEPSLLDDLELTGDIEADDKAEGEKVITSLMASQQAVDAAFDFGYELPLVFLGSAQADKFIAVLKDCVVEVEGLQCIDGVRLAKRLGIELPAVYVPKFREEKSDRKLVEQVGIIPQKKGA